LAKNQRDSQRFSQEVNHNRLVAKKYKGAKNSLIGVLRALVLAQQRFLARALVRLCLWPASTKPGSDRTGSRIGSQKKNKKTKKQKKKKKVLKKKKSPQKNQIVYKIIINKK